MKTFKELAKEEDKLREKINNNLIENDFPQDKLKGLWKNIRLLIDNEIEQEKYCGE